MPNASRGHGTPESHAESGLAPLCTEYRQGLSSGRTKKALCHVLNHTGRWGAPLGGPPGRPAKRLRTEHRGPIPECIHINKRITSAGSIEVRAVHLGGRSMAKTC